MKKVLYLLLIALGLFSINYGMETEEDNDSSKEPVARHLFAEEIDEEANNIIKTTFPDNLYAFLPYVPSLTTLSANVVTQSDQYDVQTVIDRGAGLFKQVTKNFIRKLGLSKRIQRKLFESGLEIQNKLNKQYFPISSSKGSYILLPFKKENSTEWQLWNTIEKQAISSFSPQSHEPMHFFFSEDERFMYSRTNDNNNLYALNILDPLDPQKSSSIEGKFKHYDEHTNLLATYWTDAKTNKHYIRLFDANNPQESIEKIETQQEPQSLIFSPNKRYIGAIINDDDDKEQPQKKFFIWDCQLNKIVIQESTLSNFKEEIFYLGNEYFVKPTEKDEIKDFEVLKYTGEKLPTAINFELSSNDSSEATEDKTTENMQKKQKTISCAEGGEVVMPKTKKIIALPDKYFIGESPEWLATGFYKNGNVFTSGKFNFNDIHHINIDKNHIALNNAIYGFVVYNLNTGKKQNRFIFNQINYPTLYCSNPEQYFNNKFFSSANHYNSFNSNLPDYEIYLCDSETGLKYELNKAGYKFSNNQRHLIIKNYANKKKFLVQTGYDVEKILQSLDLPTIIALTKKLEQQKLSDDETNTLKEIFERYPILKVLEQNQEEK